MQKNLIAGTIAAAMLALTSISVGAADKPAAKDEQGAQAPMKDSGRKSQPALDPKAQAEADRKAKELAVQEAKLKAHEARMAENAAKGQNRPVDEKKEREAARKAKEQAVEETRAKERAAKAAESAAKGTGQKPPMDHKGKAAEK